MHQLKKIARQLLCIGLLFGAANANALIVSDTVDPNPNISITVNSPYTFSHDLINNGFLVGTHAIFNANLLIRLIDANGDKETFNFSIGDGGQSFSCGGNANCVPNNGRTDLIALTSDSLDDLLDGKITLTLTALSGEYTFDKSVLTAAVPEPMTLALFGLGLLGLGTMRRRAR